MPEKIHSVSLDANEAIFFARELEHVKAKAYDVKYPMLKAMTLIPVSTEAGPGAETITYEQYDQVGAAKIIASYADDLPRVDIKGKEITSKIRSIGEAYGYSLQEIRAAQMAGKPLTARKAEAARRANDQTVNKIAWYGDDTHGLTGFIGHPNVPVAVVANDGTGSSTKFVDKTPDQILRDMNNLCNGIITLTKGVENPDTLLMPLEQFTKISTTARSSTSDTTILEYFLKNSPSVRTVEWVNELKGVGAGGTDIMIAYSRSPDRITLEIPQPFEQLPVQERGLEFLVPCHSRCGGVILYYPLSASIAEGI